MFTFAYILTIYVELIILNKDRTVKRKCTFCQEFEAKAETQFVVDLPSCRLQPYTPPFHHSACDYLGPMKVKLGKEEDSKTL